MYSIEEEIHNEINLRRETILKGFSNADELIKGGKPAEIGEIREFKGGKFEKTANGWVPVKKDKSPKKTDQIPPPRLPGPDLPESLDIKVPKDLGKEKKEKSEEKIDRNRFKNFDNSSGDWKEARSFYSKDFDKIENIIEKDRNLKYSLDRYTKNDYVDVRKFLSGRKEGKEYNKSNFGDIVQTIADLDGLFKKIKLESDLTLYRAVHADNTFFKDLKPGDEYEDSSFCSSSLLDLSSDSEDKQISFGNFKIEILAKKGDKVANIGNFNEHEYLINRGSKFKVLEKNNKGITVEIQ